MKLGLLIVFTRKAVNQGQPKRLAVLYAGLALVAGALLSRYDITLSLMFALAVTFLYDLVTAFLFFWLIERYESVWAFAAIILLGVPVIVGVDLLMAYAVFQ